MEYVRAKVNYIICGYNKGTGAPIIRYVSREENVKKGTEKILRIWECTFDEKGKFVSLDREVTDKVHRRKLINFMNVKNEAKRRGVENLSELDERFVNLINEEDLIQTKEKREKMARIKYAVTNDGKIMPGKEPRMNPHVKSKRMALDN